MLCPELISKLNFLEEDDQEQTLTSSNPFEEADDPVNLNPFSDPDEEGKRVTFNLLHDPQLKPLSQKISLQNERSVLLLYLVSVSY